jgi:hypothetical protein
MLAQPQDQVDEHLVKAPALRVAREGEPGKEIAARCVRRLLISPIAL